MVSLKKILNKILIDLKNTFKKSDTIPIANGGTGATTAASACSNLGIADYIVESGISGNWYYEKYASGRLVLDGYANITYTCNKPSQNVYYGSTKPTITVPIATQIITGVIATVDNSDAAFIAEYWWSGTTITINIRTHASISNQTLGLQCHFICKWK